MAGDLRCEVEGEVKQTYKGELPDLGRVLAVVAHPDAGFDRLPLCGELGGGFAGRRESEADFVVRVDRALQRRAIACHVTQSADSPVLWRRLQLEGDRELLHWLRRPGGEEC